jgi:hypothetical protein
MRRRRLLKRGGTMLKQSDVEAALTNYRAAQPLRRRRGHQARDRNGIAEAEPPSRYRKQYGRSDSDP